MSRDNGVLIREQLSPHWLAWAALNHFLPAPILRELFVVIVEQVSVQTIKLDDLFEERCIAGLPGLESWTLRARPVDGPLAIYLQHRLQHFLSRNDADAYPPEEDPLPADRTGSPRDLEDAVILGQAEFGTDPRELRTLRPQIEDSLIKLATLIDHGRERIGAGQFDGFAQDVRSQLADGDPSITSAIAKHLGDLCADSDLWQEANSLYDLARERLERMDGAVWHPYVSGMKDILLQSTATATRVLAGPGRAFALLDDGLKHASLDTNPVLALNAPYDAITAQVATGTFHNYDQRGTLLEPAFYQGSYDLDFVTFNINDKNFREALRRCWAVLRRQIGLGLASATRATKSVFGRTILAALEHPDRRREERSNFALAIRLLLESGDSTMDKFDWSQTLVDSYVDAEIVTDLWTIAVRYDGTRLERKRVAIEVLRGWLLHVSGDKHDVVDCMMQLLAQNARDEPAAFVATQNVGGRSLEILCDIARARPEFRASNAQQVEETIVSKLQTSTFWKGKSDALELAAGFLDVFLDDQVRNVVERTLDVLVAMDPAAQMWPIVRPALRLLVSQPSARLCKADPALGRRVLDTILRFGTQETQSSELLFYLREFDATLLRDSSIVATLRPTVEALCKRVENINSSGTAGDIQALLLSPAISGINGVTAALNAFKKIVRSSEANRPSIALPYCYAPLQMLADRQEAFADELAMPRSDIDQIWEEIYLEVITLWDQIRAKPALLAAFSIPPVDKPDPVLVHNWTFASVRFAESLGKRDEMVYAVQRAAQEEALRNAIKLALVIGATLDSDVAIAPEEIGGEAVDVFYAGLGRRLILLEGLERPAAMELCRSLLQQCLRFGPRGLDAAVLVYASQLGLAGQLGSEPMSNYVKRVAENKELRLSLLPLLAALKINLH
jgi:hypothetical protein